MSEGGGSVRARVAVAQVLLGHEPQLASDKKYKMHVQANAENSRAAKPIPSQQQSYSRPELDEQQCLTPKHVPTVKSMLCLFR